MPVYDIELVREDPNSSKAEISTGTVSSSTADGAVKMLVEAANKLGNRGDWDLTSIDCTIRFDMIMEGEQPATKQPLWRRILGLA